MNKEQLLQATDEQILEEVQRLQYLFGHSQIVRHGLNRDEEVYQTQSVAEHIYNMMTLALYFKPLEDPHSRWDWDKIYKMILWHDAGELETGDIVAHKKTEADEQKEIEVYKDVLGKVPLSFVPEMKPLLENYAKQDSVEDRFVNALDKLEVTISTLTPEGKVRFVDHIKASKSVLEMYIERNTPMYQSFSVIARFIDYLHRAHLEEKYYVE